MESKIIDAGGWNVKVIYEYSYDRGDYDTSPSWSFEVLEYLDPFTDAPMDIHDDDKEYIEAQLLKELI